MKKSLLHIGKVLSKAQQKKIKGAGGDPGDGPNNDDVCLFQGQTCGVNQFCCEHHQIFGVLRCQTFESCIAGPAV